MNNSKWEETRVVMMSPALLKLYEVQTLGAENDFFPITFYHPEECLEILIDRRADDEEEVADRALRVEKQWGELELRLSFFTRAVTWQ